MQNNVGAFSEIVDGSADTLNDKFSAIFGKLVTDNFIEESVVIDGVKFTLKTLTTQDYLDSDTIYMATFTELPADIIGRARMVSNLSYAIIAINDIPVTDNPLTIREDRQKLFKHLYTLPPWMIDKLSSTFHKIMKIKSDIVDGLNENPDKISEDMENF